MTGVQGRDLFSALPIEKERNYGKERQERRARPAVDHFRHLSAGFPRRGCADGKKGAYRPAGGKTMQELQTRTGTTVVENRTPAQGESGRDITVSTEKQNRSPVDFAALRQENEEICAWLFADGTKINYPVLHTSDNEYYLTHLYDRQQSDYGSLFVDYRNRSDFGDRNTVIYGHHMRNGSMFGMLEEYKAQEFYDAIPSMTLYTPGGTYQIDLVCGTEEDGNEEFVRFAFDSDEDFMDYIYGFQQRSTFQSNVSVSPRDRIVSLCTCSYDRENARYLLIGRLTKLEG